MRTETPRQRQRRAARTHWWRQVLDRPVPASWDEVFDEMVVLRFHVAEESSPAGCTEVELRAAFA